MRKNRSLMVTVALFLFCATAFGDTLINLLGSVFGGVEICDAKSCKNTPDDRETPAKIVSFNEKKGTTVIVEGKNFIVPGNQVSVSSKRCSGTLKSFLIKSCAP
jgi:hypothetical protein